MLLDAWRSISKKDRKSIFMRISKWSKKIADSKDYFKLFKVNLIWNGKNKFVFLSGFHFKFYFLVQRKWIFFVKHSLDSKLFYVERKINPLKWMFFSFNLIWPRKGKFKMMFLFQGWFPLRGLQRWGSWTCRQEDD